MLRVFRVVGSGTSALHWSDSTWRAFHMAKDHYVMRSHLANFAHPSSTGKVLFPYRKGQGLLLNKRNGIGPTGLGWGEDFYSQILPDGSSCRELDRGLQFSEKTFFGIPNGIPSAVWKCIHDPTYFPSDEEGRTHITYCTAFSHCRTPVQIHNMAMLMHISIAVEAFNAFSGDNEGMIARTMESEKLSREAAIEKMRATQQLLFDGSIYLSTKNEKQDGLNILKLEEKLWIIIEMKWELLEACPGQFFLTSDNPVVMENPQLPNKKWMPAWLKGTEVWYPISHRYGLLMRQSPEIVERRRMASHSETRSLNRRMIRRAYRHVYSPLKEDWIDEAVREERFNPMVGRLKTVKALCEAQPGKYGETVSALETHGEPTDIFEKMTLH